MLSSYFPRTVSIAIWINEIGPTGIASESDAEKSLEGIRQLGANLNDVRGLDAVILGCFADPGLDLFRSAAKVPVIGPGEASLEQGLRRGSRLGIITTVPQVVPVIRAMARAARPDLNVEAIPISPIGLPGSGIRESPEEAFSRAMAAIETLRARYEVDVICLGCMGFCWSGLASRLAQAVPQIRLVDPLQASFDRFRELVAY